MTPDQLHRLADHLDALAARLRRSDDDTPSEAERAIQRADDWRHGPRPGDNHDTPPQPGDPDYTGPADELDQVLTDTHDEDSRSAAIAARIHHDLTCALTNLDTHTRDTARLLDLLAAKHPQRGQLSPANAGDGWCTSCYRNAGHLEPIALRPDGTPRYRQLCRWCGEWASAHDGDHPPVAILREKHAGRRITQTLVQRVLGHQA